MRKDFTTIIWFRIRLSHLREIFDSESFEFEPLSLTRWLWSILCSFWYKSNILSNHRNWIKVILVTFWKWIKFALSWRQEFGSTIHESGSKCFMPVKISNAKFQPEHADRWSSRTNSFDITIQNAMRFDNGF